jgi:hypothetical protein
LADTNVAHGEIDHRLLVCQAIRIAKRGLDSHEGERQHQLTGRNRLFPEELGRNRSRVCIAFERRIHSKIFPGPNSLGFIRLISNAKLISK